MDNDKFQELVVEQFNKVFEKLDGMDNRIGKLDNRVGDLDNRIGKLDNRVGDLDNRIGKLESGQLRIETRMENEVIEKIRALFDDRSVNQDYFASIKDSLARIEETLEMVYRKSIDHEVKLVEHDREFRLLRTERK